MNTPVVVGVYVYVLLMQPSTSTTTASSSSSTASVSPSSTGLIIDNTPFWVALKDDANYSLPLYAALQMSRIKRRICSLLAGAKIREADTMSFVRDRHYKLPPFLLPPQKGDKERYDVGLSERHPVDLHEVPLTLFREVAQYAIIEGDPDSSAAARQAAQEQLLGGGDDDNEHHATSTSQQATQPHTDDGADRLMTILTLLPVAKFLGYVTLYENILLPAVTSRIGALLDYGVCRAQHDLRLLPGHGVAYCPTNLLPPPPLVQDSSTTPPPETTAPLDMSSFTQHFDNAYGLFLEPTPSRLRTTQSGRHRNSSHHHHHHHQGHHSSASSSSQSRSFSPSSPSHSHHQGNHDPQRRRHQHTPRQRRPSPPPVAKRSSSSARRSHSKPPSREPSLSPSPSSVSSSSRSPVRRSSRSSASSGLDKKRHHTSVSSRHGD